MSFIKVVQTLAAGQCYLLDGGDIGTFVLKGGACGNFTVTVQADAGTNGDGDNSNVTIKDEHGSLVFPPKQVRWLGPGYLTIRDDDKEEGTSKVVYESRHDPGAKKYDPEEVVHVRRNVQELEKFGQIAILLTGPRTFVVTGSDKELSLSYSGSGRVYVYGDLSRLLHCRGRSMVRIQGSVKGSVHQVGEGLGLIIDGSVGGDLHQNEPSKTEVKGNVGGDIQVEDGGELLVRGRHHGNVKMDGASKIKIGLVHHVVRD